jgi:sugar/nucleoside kinase (ribokinase family)
LLYDISYQLPIYCIVIHLVDCAAAIVDGKYYYTDGPYTPNPILTTGAGDNFNAGFCLGQLTGSSIQMSLILGVASSGFYVRHAISPTIEELANFLEAWNNQDKSITIV